MIEQSKSPKSCAYARLGKPHSGKNSVPQQIKKNKRKSAGNIYEQILQQFKPDQNQYIRKLVSKNEKQQQQVSQKDVLQGRRKSYADLDSASKQKSKMEAAREQRQTLCKPKYAVQTILQQQSTPKATPNMSKKIEMPSRNNVSGSSQQIIFNAYKRELQKHEEKSFIDSLNNYLEELNQTKSHISRVNIQGEKLSETLKIKSNDSDSYKLVAKLQQSHNKIKELKLKNFYQQKQLGKCAKKQAKMKESLYEMLRQIKLLNGQLSRQKKEKRRLEKIIDNFEMRRQKLERKTIGKHYQLKIQQLQSDLHELTESDHGRSDNQTSFRDYWKNATAERKKNKNGMKMFDEFEQLKQGRLDSEKIQKMFRSNFHSQQQDNY